MLLCEIFYFLSPFNPLPADVRLAGRGVSYEGHVEVYKNGVWGTICADFWNDRAATIICHELGLGDYGTTVFNSSASSVSSPILLTNVRCTGKELSLFDCFYTEIQQEDCTTMKVAGVTCSS